MSEKLSASDLYFSIACFIQGTVLLTSYTVIAAKHETWMVIIFSFIVSFFIILSYISLINRFPGCGISKTMQSIYGKKFGNAISFSYLLFFIFLTIFNVREIGNFIAIYLLPETSLWIVILSFVSVLFFAVNSGIQNILRFGFVFFTLTFIIILANIFFLIPYIDFENFLPMFSLHFSNYLEGFKISTSVNFCETIVFLAIAPFFSDSKISKRGYIAGLIMGFISLLIIVFCETSVLGITASSFTNPYYETVRFINLFDVVNRLETLFSLITIIMRFYKISILYFVSAFVFSELFNIKMNKITNALIGIIISILSCTIIHSRMQLRNIVTSYYSYILGLFEIVIPLISLIIASSKKKKS